MYPSIKEAKELVCDIGRKMYMRGIVTANAGNITVRCGERQVVMTPTGICKGDLSPEMLLVVDFDGNVIDGTTKPTCEMQMHLNVYRTDDSIMSTCHAHSLYLSVFASAGIEIDLPLSPETVLLAGRVPIIPFNYPGSKELADSIIPYVKDHCIVTLANHGPISWGKTPVQAWYIMDGAEKYAHECLLHKYVLGKLNPLSNAQIAGIIEREFPVSDSMLVEGAVQSAQPEDWTRLSHMDCNKVELSDATLEKLATYVVKKLKEH